MALSERERARLLDVTHDAILVRTLPGVIRFWNRGAEQLYGWSGADALGRTSHELLQTRFPQPLERILEVLIRDGRWDGELTHVRRDGTIVVVESRWVLEREAGGRPSMILELNTDITARHQAEDLVRQYHGRIDAALRNRNLLLFSQDADLRYTWVRNARLGFDDETLVGVTDEVLDPASSAELTALKRETLATGCGGRRVVYARHGQDGAWFDVSVEPTRDGAGAVVGLTGTAIDITETKRLERQALDERQRFQLALEAGGMGVFERDLRTERVTWSAECGVILGVVGEGGATADVMGLVDPVDLPRVEAKLAESLTTVGPLTFEFRITRPGAGSRWIREIVETHVDEQGRPVSQIGLVKDITDRKLAEELLDALTPRECEVLRLVADGKSSKELAIILGISAKTAETHRTNLMRKLELHSVSELVRFAVRSQLVEP